jgi:hypothetical protein
MFGALGDLDAEVKINSALETVRDNKHFSQKGPRLL